MAKSDVGRVLEMIHGYQQTCLVVAGIQLGVFDRLAEGATSVADLATDLGAKERHLGRLLRALSVLGLVSVSDGVSLTETGRLLLKDGLGAGMRAWATLVGGEYLAAWGQLAHTVRTGEVGFHHVFGKSAWEHRQEHPELNESFNRVTTGEQLRAITAVVRSYDFSRFSLIADIGGGHGNLVAGILAKTPQARGLVFDLPHVVAGASAALAAAGVGDRCDTAGGSFLEAIPPGADAFLLKHVLHNWDDDDCVKILGNLRDAMGPASVLLVLENVVPEQDLALAAPIVMLDIHMMAVLGGIERTTAEYRDLCDRVGLSLERVMPTRPGAPDIIEIRRRGEA